MASRNAWDRPSNIYEKTAELQQLRTVGHTAAGKPLKSYQDGQETTLEDREDRSVDRMKARDGEKTSRS